MSILDQNISYYPGIAQTNKGIVINLLKLLESLKHKTIVEQLRNELDPFIQKQLKEKLPCFTPSGIFNGRSAAGLVKSTGLAAIDLDSAEDYDAISLMHELKKLPFISYCGLSCRGQRLFCIIPFATDAYQMHYERLIQSFEDIGLPMGDSCHKQISQPRFVSFNDENTCFYNHSAKKYNLLPTQKSYHSQSPATKIFAKTPNNSFLWCVDWINKSHSFIAGKRHEYIMRLARYCNLKGLDEIQTLKGCLEFQKEDFPDTEITNLVQFIYRAHFDSHNKLPFKKK